MEWLATLAMLVILAVVGVIITGKDYLYGVANHSNDFLIGSSV